MFSESMSNPEVQKFMLEEKTNLFLVDKIVLIIMVPVLINKVMFEPNYNDLKFMVWNCNYFCTNLISGLTFRSLIHFEFIFVYDIKESYNFIFFTCRKDQRSQKLILWKDKQNW